MNRITAFFKNFFARFREKPLVPSAIVRSGLPMVLISKKILQKPKGLLERVVQNIKQFFGRA